MKKRGCNAKFLGIFLKKFRIVVMFSKRIAIYPKFCVASLLILLTIKCHKYGHIIYEYFVQHAHISLDQQN